MERKDNGDESPRTVLDGHSRFHSPALFTGNSLRAVLPAIEGCPARRVKHRRLGGNSGDELWQEDELHLKSMKRAASVDSSSMSSTPDLLPALEGCPTRSAKRRRVGVKPGEEELCQEDELHLDSSERAANSSPRMLADLLPALNGYVEDAKLNWATSERASNADSSSGMLTKQEVSGLNFDQLPDDVILKILGGSDLRRRIVVSTVSKNLRSVVKRNISPCCGRFSTNLECQLNSTARWTSLSSICTLGRDEILKIMCKLTTADLAILGRTCAGFRCALACSESRCFIRKYSENYLFLGALVSCNALSKYPVLLSPLLPRQQQPAVKIFAAFWRTFARSSKLSKVEVVDCRDGRIVLSEGKPCKKIIICNPFALNRPTTVVLELPSNLIQEESGYVCCTIVPHDDGYKFSIFLLMATGATGREYSVRIAKYVSSIDCWSSKRHLWDSEVPTRATIKLPSVLSDKKVHYLQPAVQIIRVDNELNIDRIPLPGMSRLSSHNHLLVQRTSGKLCLVVVTGKKVSVFEFKTSSYTWMISQEFEGPDEENDCQIVGSGTDRIILRAIDKLWCMDLLDGCHSHVSIASKFIREAFCYEMQHPPVAELLQRKI